MPQILDSYAWMEYFAATPAGIKVREIIENGEKNELITLDTTIGELSCLYGMRGKDFGMALEVILANSTIQEVPFGTWKEVGLFRKEMRSALKDDTVGIMDAILLCMATEMGSSLKKGIKIVTGDPHFKKLSRIPKYRKFIRII
ncbi:MAG: PIN domain-containing protein [Candidatus Micrarchaeota archaeon]